MEKLGKHTLIQTYVMEKLGKHTLIQTYAAARNNKQIALARFINYE